MSKFFRRPSSSDSSSSTGSDEDHANGNHGDDATEEINIQGLSFGSGNDSLESIPRERVPDAVANSGRDLLLHALLEERCLNQVRKEWGANSSEVSIQREARRRYQTLCTHLSPLDLVSVGPQDERYATTRQHIRDRLDSVQLREGPLSQALQSVRAAQPSLPAPLRRLLTESDASGPASIFRDLEFLPQPQLPKRYVSDFEEIGMLGKGGYGEVFHVRHRLDGRLYAVKRVPIRPNMVAHIAAGGEAAINELLAEVRSLSRLDHPNVVRYFSSWIEWSSSSSIVSSSSELTSGNIGEPSADAVAGAEHSNLFASLDRVQTQSNTKSFGDIGITFEDSRSRQASISGISQARLSSADSREELSGALISTSQQALALHMQMDVYPMTLADFLSPKSTRPGEIAPLCHCFHLKPSVEILIAILDGVEYLHTENIVHRDLKPANCFVRHESNPRATRSCVDLFLCPTCRAEKRAQPAQLSVCIGDFGLVTNIAQTSDAILPPTTAVGTEIYRPAKAKSNVSPRLDVYAVGIIACELFCSFGTQMERRQTLEQIKRGHFPEGFASCAGQQSAKVKECVQAMLLDTKEEEPTIQELKQRLSSILQLASAPSDTSETVLRPL